MKASLSLLKVPISVEKLAAMFEKITGRKPSVEDIETAKFILKGQHQ